MNSIITIMIEASVNRFLSMAAILFGSAALGADEPSISLEAKVVKAGTFESFGPELQVRLVGVAKEAVVTTDGFRMTISRKDKQVTVTLTTAEEEKDTKERRVIPSQDRLGIVKLEPGEVAIVRVPGFMSDKVTPELHQAVGDAALGDVTLVVEYEVSALLGKRYGVTSGKFTATASTSKKLSR